MARYTMPDGTILDTKLAQTSWDEDSDWDGNNHVSRATGQKFEHEKLYLSSKGRYWVEHWSQWQGSTAYAGILTEEEAATWLLKNNHPIPGDLADCADIILE